MTVRSKLNMLRSKLNKMKRGSKLNIIRAETNGTVKEKRVGHWDGTVAFKTDVRSKLNMLRSKLNSVILRSMLNIFPVVTGCVYDKSLWNLVSVVVFFKYAFMLAFG